MTVLLRQIPFGVVLASAFALGGCGGGNSTPSQADPEFGLDARPVNLTCLAPERPTGTATVAIENASPRSPGFSSPTKLLQAPGDASRWFVLQQTGIVKAFSVVGQGAGAVNFLDWRSRIRLIAEGGLLGMAFHPDFPEVKEVFLSYTGDAGQGTQSIVSRVLLDDTNTPLNVEEQIILAVDQPGGAHRGGDIAFGPDGYLYIGLGDGDSAANGQDTTTLKGSFLRLEVNDVPWPDERYRIPIDNPFSGNSKCGSGGNANSCPEIFAWGFRNPWRWSFDPDTGALWAGDVGFASREEIDVVELGGNYGWPCREGTRDHLTATCPAEPTIDPVAEYPNAGGAAVIGGVIYRGSAMPDLRGHYVFADLISGTFFALTPDEGGNLAVTEIGDTPALISAIAVDQAGEIHYVDMRTELVYRLIPGGNPVPDTIAESLADSGCADPANPGTGSSGMIPYSINAPFWSDGAAKMRYLSLPDGATITVGADGDWEMPAGSVLRKDFRIAGKLIETRLLMRHPDGVWAGYTYEWNEAETSATRIRGGKAKSIDSQSWIFPSESQCMKCHTAAAGFSLGIETAQLNRRSEYASTGRVSEQLLTLDHIGVVDIPLADAPNSLPRLAEPFSDDAGVDEQARSWLHTNCSQCHRPGGPTPAQIDLRSTVGLGETGTCDVVPALGDVGLGDPRIVAPGFSSRSVLAARVGRRDVFGMPPLGSTQVDSAGSALLNDWIESLANCE
jgi:uncharacterized repeat protein (TIGR03806 family)